MREIDHGVLKRIGRTGPMWLRSLSVMRPCVDRLLSDGMIEQCRPEGGIARNMVRITDKGRAALGQGWPNQSEGL